jgi:hypothetical protein
MMKKILLSILIVVAFTSCEEMKKTKEFYADEQKKLSPASTEYTKIRLVELKDFEGYNQNVGGFDFVRDSCEYTYLWTGAGNGGGTIFHKGNCKYCQERNKKMIENLLKKYYHE